MKYIIFSIDNVSDTHTLAKFMRHMDTRRAMGNMKGEMKQAIGCWQGVLELSFILKSEDFYTHVMPFGFCDNQECVMEVEYGHKGRAFAKLKELCTTYIYSFNTFNEVTKDEAMKAKGFTYRPDMNSYWVAE